MADDHGNKATNILYFLMQHYLICTNTFELIQEKMKIYANRNSIISINIAVLLLLGAVLLSNGRYKQSTK